MNTSVAMLDSFLCRALSRPCRREGRVRERGEALYITCQHMRQQCLACLSACRLCSSPGSAAMLPGQPAHTAELQQLCLCETQSLVYYPMTLW